MVRNRCKGIREAGCVRANFATAAPPKTFTPRCSQFWERLSSWLRLPASVLVKPIVAAVRILEGSLVRNERNLLGAAMAGFFPVPAAVSLSGEVICPPNPRLKPLRCVCGKLIDPLGGPVSGAIVTVLNDGTGLARVETAGGGKFAFGELKSGDYELSCRSGSSGLGRRSASPAGPFPVRVSGPVAPERR